MDQIGQLCGITGMNVLDEIQRMQTVWTDDGREVIDLSTREIAMRLDDYASRREASTKEEEETNGIE